MSASSFQVFSDKGTSLVFDLEDDTTGYEVREIEGLDPVKANLVFSSFAHRDGEIYQSSRREKRYITFKLGMAYGTLGGTVKTLRDRLYDYFMPKSMVTLRFFQEDGPTVDISGIVESFDAPLFVEDPEATIVVVCGDSDFTVLANVIETGTTYEAPDVVNLEIDYVGKVETGYILKINITHDVDEIILSHTYPNGLVRKLIVDNNLDLISGDELTISTIPGNKGVWVERSDELISLLNAVDTTSYWPQLFNGVNTLKVSTPGVDMEYTVSYLTRYGGL